MGKVRDGHIGYTEAIAMVILFLIGKVIVLPTFSSLGKETRSAGWIVLLIGLILNLAGLYLLVWVLKKFPGASINMITEKVTGKYVGSFFNLIIFLTFYINVILGTREFTEMLKTSVLPITPISVLFAVLLLTLLYAAYQGIESLSRGNWLFFPFYLFVLLVIMVGVVPFIHPNYIFPLLGSGIGPIIKSTIVRSYIFSDILILGIIAPYLRNKGKLFKTGFWGLIISGFISVILYIIYYSVFDKESGDVIFPVYQLARLIYFGRFLQRVEVIFVIIWVFVFLSRIAIALYSSAIVIAETLKLPNYRPLLFPLTVLAFTAALVPTGFPQAIKLEVLRMTGLVGAIIIPLVLWIVALIRKKSLFPKANK